MSDKRAFAIAWFHAGLCPGCQAPLEDVAGQGKAHYLPGQRVRPAYSAVTKLGQVIQAASITVDDPRVCDWSADDLTSLVLIGSGTVKYHPGEGHGPRPRDCPDPVSSPSAIDRAGAHK